MFPRKPYVVPLSDGRALHLGGRTVVMGIINVTPDSFADAGLRYDPPRAIAAGLEMEAAGAEILDVGGESSRPGAEPVSADEEVARVLPVIEGLVRQVRIPISIDTYKAPVAAATLDAGAVMVNDISGLRYDRTLADVAASWGAALVLMHNRGRSRDIYREAVYAALSSDVATELRTALDTALASGVGAEHVVLDPGLGFAKRAEHSYAILAQLHSLASLDRPLLVGPSRKSFLLASLGELSPERRDWGTAAAVTAAVCAGAHIVRVHAVREMVQVVRVADALRRYREAFQPLS